MQDASGASGLHASHMTGDQGVLLSVEPVHIYTDSTATGSSGLCRERRLKDVTADGQNIFHEAQPVAVQLGEDVRRLWAEFGDFLNFSSQTLVDRIERQSRKRKVRTAKVKAQGADTASSDEDDDNVSSTSNEEIEDGVKPNQKLAQDQYESSIGGTIKESEFVALRDQVLSKLDVAHFNSIHAHQLLGMLIKAHKPVSGAHGTNARLSSPAPSLGAGSTRSASVPRPGQSATASALAPLGIFTNLTHASSKEDDFVLDPLALSLSRTNLNTAVSARRIAKIQEDGSDDELDASDPGYGVAQAKKELEASSTYKEERLRDFKIALTTKREALRSAADLLQAGAEELRSCHSSERERWRGLIGLRNRGWALAPGRPLLDMERFGDRSASVNDDDDSDKSSARKEAAQEEDKQNRKNARPRKAAVASSLQGFGTPILTSDGKVKEEGARDAWIGFGLPEAPIELRRRTLAYWADTLKPDSSTESASPALVTDKVVFPDRPRRRLRVDLVLWPTITADQKVVWTSDRAIGSASSDDTVLPLAQVLDDDLQQASREASDELVFGDVVSQARQLAPAFGVRLTASTVRIILTAKLDLVVQLVPTEPIHTQETETEKDKTPTDHSPFASLILAYLRSSPLRKWNTFASATREARSGDINSKALALRAWTLSAPRRPHSSFLYSDGPNAISDVPKGTSDGKDSTSVPKDDSLGPLLVTLHYSSFVMQLHGILRRLQDEMNGRTKEVCQLDFVPLTGLVTDESRPILSAIMEAILQRSSRKELDLHATSTNQYRPGSNYPDSGLNALSGYAKVWIEGSLTCTLDFTQPSELTARFQGRAQRGGASLTTLAIGAGRPLHLDLATLDDLLRQQIAQSQ